MSTNVETLSPLAKELFLYLFKLTSFCTDSPTEEAYLQKSYRAEFNLGLAKLTFNFLKIALSFGINSAREPLIRCHFPDYCAWDACVLT